jgi:hypothetical protein
MSRNNRLLIGASLGQVSITQVVARHKVRRYSLQNLVMFITKWVVTDYKGSLQIFVTPYKISLHPLRSRSLPITKFCNEGR